MSLVVTCLSHSSVPIRLLQDCRSTRGAPPAGLQLQQDIERRPQSHSKMLSFKPSSYTGRYYPSRALGPSTGVCRGSISNAAKPMAGADPASISPEQQEQRDAGAPRAPITLEFCLSPSSNPARWTRDRLLQQLRAGGTRRGLCALLGTILESGTTLWIPAPPQPTPNRLNFCCCCCH